MKFPSHLKKTKGRLKVFEIFMDLNESISVDELHNKCTEIHLATLYRIVDEFSKANVIRLSDDFNPEVRRYERYSHKHQHKLKCVDCGQEVILETCPLHFHAPEGFVVLDHRIEIEGLCKDCAQKRSHT